MRLGTRPTIIDVARIAGVSPTTVSYVLSGPKERAARISEETTSRIQDVVREIGYVPNQSARTLRLQRTNSVLFLGSRITSIYSQIIARSIERRLVDHRLALGVQIGSGSDHIERAIGALEQGQADGLIVETTDEYAPDLRAAAARGHAIVAIGLSSPDPAFDVLSNEDAPAIRDAMSHVVERGYQHFVLLSSLPDVVQEHRIHVADQQLKALGMTGAQITILHCPHDRIGAYHATLDLLSHVPRPVAIYPGADLSAIGVLWACLNLGIEIPQEVAIIGHGNTPETHITVPPLTGLGPVNSDFSKAADLMASRLSDPSLPGRFITEPCHLYIRESS